MLLPGQTGYLFCRKHPHQNVSNSFPFLLKTPKVRKEIASRGYRWGLFVYHYLGFPEAGMSYILFLSEWG